MDPTKRNLSNVAYLNWQLSVIAGGMDGTVAILQQCDRLGLLHTQFLHFGIPYNTTWNSMFTIPVADYLGSPMGINEKMYGTFYVNIL